MDPDTTLSELRTLLPAVREGEVVAEEFLDRFEALDEWLRKGGYLPAAWWQA